MTDLSAYLTETATLHRSTGVNAYGEDRFDTGADVRCRVRLQRLATQQADGEARRCTGEVWLAPDQVVAPGDQFLYDGDYLRVTAVEAVLDVAGACCGLRAKVG
jgi:hypothetical protein